MPIDITKINNIIIKKGLSYSDLAEKSGISRTQISRIINSKNTRCRTKTISKLIKALDIDYEDICKKGSE